MAAIKPYDVAKPFRRTNNFPLDVTSVFASVEEANSYLSGETSYLGQVLAVVTSQRDVEIYKVGYNSVENKKVLLPIGGSAEATTTETIVIDAGGQQYTIPMGSDLTDSLGYVKEAIEAVDSRDGKITEDIVVDGKTVAVSGTPVTTVFADVYSRILNMIVEINAVGDGDIDAYASGDTVYVSLKGVSNDKITLDEEKTVTLTLNLNGGESAELEGMVLTGSTYGDTLDIALPNVVPSKGTERFTGWWLDMNSDEAHDSNEVFQAGSTITLTNLTSISPYTGTITALWVE